MKIPALTIYQPYASLIACSAKKYETRSWATKYRGRIAIHAGNKAVLPWFQRTVAKDARLKIIDTLAVHRKMHGNKNVTGILTNLPRGCIIATAELVDCWYIVYNPGTDIDKAKKIPIGAELDVPKKHPRFHDFIVPEETEVLFGDWTPGRYAWELRNIKMLDEPIPAKGKQRLWYVDLLDEIVGKGC